MQFSLMKNDKSTYWDEVVLAIMVICSLILGIALIVLRPSIWIISSTVTTTFGVILALFGIMFIPILIYRLKTNEKH